MVHFLNFEDEMEFRQYVMFDLAKEIGLRLEVYEQLFVKGGLFGDEIVESLKIRFFPEDATINGVDDEIASKIHRYIYEHDLGLVRELNLEKDVFNNRIRYALVYTYAGDYVECEKCQRKCKQGVTRCLYPIFEE